MRGVLPSDGSCSCDCFSYPRVGCPATHTRAAPLPSICSCRAASECTCTSRLLSAISVGSSPTACSSGRSTRRASTWPRVHRNGIQQRSKATTAAAPKKPNATPAAGPSLMGPQLRRTKRHVPHPAWRACSRCPPCCYKLSTVARASYLAHKVSTQQRGDKPRKDGLLAAAAASVPTGEGHQHDLGAAAVAGAAAACAQHRRAVLLQQQRMQLGPPAWAHRRHVVATKHLGHVPGGEALLRFGNTGLQPTAVSRHPYCAKLYKAELQVISMHNGDTQDGCKTFKRFCKIWR